MFYKNDTPLKWISLPFLWHILAILTGLKAFRVREVNIHMFTKLRKLCANSQAAEGTLYFAWSICLSLDLFSRTCAVIITVVKLIY